MRLILLILFTLLSFGAAQPGTLREVTLVETLSAAQIDAATGGRFRNDGSDAPGALYDVDSYLVTLDSTGFDGEASVITAQVFVPRLDEPRPVFVFGAGSTGLVEACAPSRGYAENRSLETYGAYTLAYAGQGFVSVMPNYEGFFDVGKLQPYFVLKSEGQTLLDAARATLALGEREGFATTETFVGGFSQGGHAAFAAADLASDYAPELELSGVIGFGATTDLTALFREFTYVAPWVVYAYDAFFPERIAPSDILLGGYAEQLEADAERFCVGGVQNYYPTDPAALYTPEFAEALAAGELETRFPEIYELFAENDAGLAGHELPALMLQGVDDPVVTFETQTEFVEQLCEAGSPVRYPNYLRTRHETRYIGFAAATEWMNALANGDDAPSDCDALP